MVAAFDVLLNDNLQAFQHALNVVVRCRLEDDMVQSAVRRRDGGLLDYGWLMVISRLVLLLFIHIAPKEEAEDDAKE